MTEARSYITISVYPHGEYSFDPLEEHPTVPDNLVMEYVPDEPAYYIVQFQEPLTEEQRALLQERYQLRLNEYIPRNAFVEWLRPEQRAALSREPVIRAIVVNQPAFKISPFIGRVEFRTPERKEMEGLWLDAVLAEEADPSQLADLLSEANASQISVLDDREIGGRLRVQFVVPSEESLPDIARLTEVRWIEEVPEVIEDNGTTAGTVQSGTPGTVPIWDQGIHGEGQIIGVIDASIVEINHCWFRDNTNNAAGPAHRKVVRIRGSASDFFRDRRHAQFVSGIAVGDDVNNLGADPQRGLAWASRITSDVHGRDSILAQLTAAAADGAFIHTNSWHDNTAGALQPALYNQTAVDVDTFTSNNPDHLVLGSSGNVSRDILNNVIGEEQGPPGTAKNAICVSAAQQVPNQMNFGDGNPGPTADGRRKPDLFAPGCTITSSLVDTNCATQTRGCASSWATPAAAAAAALVRQYYTEGFYPTGRRQPQRCGFKPTGALLKATLLNSTIDMTGIPGFPGDQEGWGLIQLNNTLFFAGGAAPSVRDLRVWDTRDANGLTFGETRHYNVNVASNTQALKITLVWTDRPGTLFSAPQVNNLNLVAVSPTVQTFLGNNFAGGASATGGTADNTNNVEMVLINNPTPGRWDIQVTGAEINVGRQGYALVVSADLTTGLPTPFIVFSAPGLRSNLDLRFGDAAVGDIRDQELTITNLGPGNATVTFPPPPPPGNFSWPAMGSFEIGPCSPRTVNLKFQPTGTGDFKRTLKVTSNAPDSPQSISLQGRGTEGPPP